jgi:hypothetical protein
MESHVESNVQTLPEDIENLAKKEFSTHAKADSNSINQEEYYSFLSSYLSHHAKNWEELFKNLKDENFYNVHLNKEEEKMNESAFVESFKDLWFYARNHDSDLAIHIDNLDEL